MRRQFDAMCRQYEVKRPQSRNLLDLSASREGYITAAGAYAFATHCRVTDPIPVAAGETYTIILKAPVYNIGVSVFDSTGTVLTRSNNWSGQAVTFTVAGNGATARFWFSYDEVNPVPIELLTGLEAQLLKGSYTTPPDYVPYGAPAVYGVGEWYNGVKSGFPSVKLPGKTEQQSYTGKNLFNVLAIETHPEWQQSIVSVDGNGFVVRTPDGYSGNGNTSTGKQLREMAPGLAAGKTYTLSMTSDSAINNFMDLPASGFRWVSGRSRVMTEEDLSSEIYVYGFQQSEGEGTGDCRISRLQIEEGTTATAYEPYVGGVPAPNPMYPQEVKANKATVRSLGKNLLKLDLEEFNAAPAWGAGSKSSLFQAAMAHIPFKTGTQYTVSAETKLADGSNGVHYIVFRYTDGSRSPYGGFELTDARYGIEGHRVITSAARKTISSIEIESGYGGPFETFWMQLEEGAVATSYEPYFDGGEATTPTLMCAADGTCQSTYDTQTGEFVNWWWDKITFDGSEVWSAINDLNTNFGFCTLAKIQEFDHNAHFWSNQTLPDRLTTSLDGTPMLQYTPGLGLIAYDFGFYDKTLNDLGKANWKAHLAEHPLEVWVARNEPEITTIGPQPLTCPTGYGQIIQTAGDIPDCPMEIQYLAHGGNVK